MGLELDLTGLFDADSKTTQQEVEKPLKYHSIDEQKQRQQEAFKTHKEILENILKSETLRGEINRDIKAGADTKEILIKAIECISLMTGDKLFYSINKENI